LKIQKKVTLVKIHLHIKTENTKHVTAVYSYLQYNTTQVCRTLLCGRKAFAQWNTIPYMTVVLYCIWANCRNTTT